MPEYDVIVVGAGPGGSSAAYSLAARGAKVLLLDKKTFPRAKTCGDGLTPRAVKVMAAMGMAQFVQESHKVTGLRTLGANRVLEMDFPRVSNFPSFGFIRTRKDLDAAIAQRAANAGAEVLFGVEAEGPLMREGRVSGVRWVRKEKLPKGGVVRAEEGEFTSHFTIVADGASSPFGRAMGLMRQPDYPMGLAIRTYYQADRDDDPYMESWLELRRGDALLPGYGWIFPVGDGRVNVGVGLLTTFGKWRQVNLSQLQRFYVEMLPKEYGITHETQMEPYQSGRLPMGGGLRKPYGPGWLAIGDAAGYVNPFNGEGIAYAMETAQIAAADVAGALQSGRTTDVPQYAEHLRESYGAYFKMGRRFTKIIGNPRAFRALCYAGLRSQTLMELVFKVLANLGDDRGGGPGDRAFRGLIRLAERQVERIEDPVVPLPPSPPNQQKVGAA